MTYEQQQEEIMRLFKGCITSHCKCRVRMKTVGDAVRLKNYLEGLKEGYKCFIPIKDYSPNTSCTVVVEKVNYI